MSIITEARHLAVHDIGRTLECVPRSIPDQPPFGVVAGTIVALTGRGSVVAVTLDGTARGGFIAYLKNTDMVRVTGAVSPPCTCEAIMTEDDPMATQSITSPTCPHHGTEPTPCPSSP